MKQIRQNELKIINESNLIQLQWQFAHAEKIKRKKETERKWGEKEGLRKIINR